MTMTSRKRAFFLSLVISLFLLTSVFPAAAEKAGQKSRPAEWDSCTSIEVGRLATVDGSVITCHTCDGPYRTWLNIVPYHKWPDKAMNKIYSGQRLGQGGFQSAHDLSFLRGALLNSGQQFVEGVREQLHAIDRQLRRSQRSRMRRSTLRASGSKWF